MAATVTEEEVAAVESGSSGAEKEPSVAEEKKGKKKKERGMVSRVLRGLFTSRKEDLEGRLERISKKEANVMARMRRRQITSRSMKSNLIRFGSALEIVAVGYAITMSRTLVDWKRRAFHILPIFILPPLFWVIYVAVAGLMNRRNKKDEKTLEKLRTERQSKIDELKEKTNYFITQQLIQRYDTDPAAKAAAATFLASKLGTDSGLKVYVGEDPNVISAAGRSNDVEVVPSNGLRNRKQPLDRSNSMGSTVLHHPDEAVSLSPGVQSPGCGQRVCVDHYQGQGSAANAGGWLARVAALLVGEDPTQCFALICGNCYMHNGLASKEDFPHVAYICPHCGAMNGPRYRGEHASGPNTPNIIVSLPPASYGNADDPNLQSLLNGDDENAISPSVGSTTTVDNGNTSIPAMVADEGDHPGSSGDKKVDNVVEEVTPEAVD